MSQAPVEAKVYAATIGTGAGAVISTFVVWLLGVLVWHAPLTAAGATEAVAAVPGPVTAVVGLLITVGSAFGSGYLAKHTPRPQREVDSAPIESGLISNTPVADRDKDDDGHDDRTGHFLTKS